MVQIGPSDGSTNWSEQVLAEFSLSANNEQLIHVHNSSAGIPLIFTDIFTDIAAYEDRRMPSFSNKLMAKGLARQIGNSQIISWYQHECDKLVQPDAVESLRLVDLHRFQMPLISFTSGATGLFTSSMNQSSIVGNVTVKPQVLSVGTDAKQAAPSTLLPKTNMDPLQKEKMDRIQSWLKEGAHEQWRKNAVKMVVDDVPVEKDSKFRSERQEGRGSRTDNEAAMRSNNVGVPLQNNTVSSSDDRKSSQPRLPKSRYKLSDTPERDVDRSDHFQPTRDGISQLDCSIEQSVNQPSCGSGQKRKSSESLATPPGGESKTRISLGDAQERPLFMRDDSEPRRCVVSGKKDSAEVCESWSPKFDSVNTVGGQTFKFSATDTCQQPTITVSPPSTKTETKSHLPTAKLLDNESLAAGTQSETTNKAVHDVKEPSTMLCGAGSDSHASASANIESCSVIPAPSSAAAVTNHPPQPDASEELEELGSECSSGLLDAAKIRIIESDIYLTANESSSTASPSVTPRKNFSTVPSVESAVFPNSDTDRRDDETMIQSDHVAAAAEELTSELSVKLEIPASRCMMVFISAVESPDRFWVNVACEEVTVIDQVTEILNNCSTSESHDPSLIQPKLHQCYCVRSVADGLYYRAKVIEICYGDAHCKYGSSKDCNTCTCDQLIRPDSTPAKAVQVRYHFYVCLCA